MRRFAVISAATYGYMGAPRTPGSHHGTAFTTTFNGWDEEKAKTLEGTFVKSGRRLEGARVVKIWDPDLAAAKRLADVCGIDEVAASAEAACDGVDAVLIIDDGSGAQWKYAVHPLKKGVPVFCDKPLAMTAREAQGVAKLVRETKTPFMSASSLRFVPDIVKLREELSQLGNVYLASAACGNELVYYGIHALSMIYGVLGGGAVSAINVGQPGANLVRLRFANHRDVMLIVGEKQWMRAGYQINLYGEKGWRSLQPDLTNLYSYLLEAFLNLLDTGKESVPVEEEVEVIAALEAGRRSLELGREVLLSEVLGEE
ncbi:MAG: Gfo/Idh/MocA family oxidoreductase [Verrucomicrobiae bacterium]|nr:Gfo/Idh/MocA family oxidoreductase [Verrucomicrobiae bacterium]